MLTELGPEGVLVHNKWGAVDNSVVNHLEEVDLIAVDNLLIVVVQVHLEDHEALACSVRVVII